MVIIVLCMQIEQANYVASTQGEYSLTGAIYALSLAAYLVTQDNVGCIEKKCQRNCGSLALTQGIQLFSLCIHWERFPYRGKLGEFPTFDYVWFVAK